MSLFALGFGAEPELGLRNIRQTGGKQKARAVDALPRGGVGGGFGQIAVRRPVECRQPGLHSIVGSSRCNFRLIFYSFASEHAVEVMRILVLARS